MTTRTIRSHGDIAGLAALLAARELPVTVTVTKGRVRTSRQNRLQRQWCNDVAAQLGDLTAEEVRGEMKLRFGVPILRAEDEAFAAAYDERVKPLPYEAKLALMMEPLDLPVTRRMTTAQLTRYLDAIHAHYSAQGVVLTQPEERA